MGNNVCERGKRTAAGDSVDGGGAGNQPETRRTRSRRMRARPPLPAAVFRGMILVVPGKRASESPETPRESAGEGSTDGLLEQARRGNRSAAGVLFERCRPWLRRWARGRLPAWARDGIDTSDVVHDALSRTFVRLETFQSNRASALRAYLQRAVENRVHDQLRRVQRRSTLRAADAPSWVTGNGTSRLHQWLDDDGRREYLDGLAHLTPRERRLIVGRVEMGYGYRQLAFVEGMSSADAARKALGRALRRLIDIAD